MIGEAIKIVGKVAVSVEDGDLGIWLHQGGEIEEAEDTSMFISSPASALGQMPVEEETTPGTRVLRGRYRITVERISL